MRGIPSRSDSVAHPVTALYEASSASDQSGQILTFAPGWISGGRLYPLAGAAQVFPQGIAW
jgi:hypothetical protein